MRTCAGRLSAFSFTNPACNKTNEAARMCDIGSGTLTLRISTKCLASLLVDANKARLSTHTDARVQLKRKAVGFCQSLLLIITIRKQLRTE